jgi:hypothetical protein
MTRRRRTLLLGLAVLLLLAGCVAVAVFRPTPNEAERAAARIEVGVAQDQAEVSAQPALDGPCFDPSRAWEGRLDRRPPVSDRYAAARR